MVRVLSLLAVTLLAGCFDLPQQTVVTDFDGQWVGRRVNETDNPVCLPTRITGSIEQGKVAFVLEYNGTVLSGRVSEYGQLRLSDNNVMWQYQFSGRATPEQIKGEWRVGNAGCKGHWYLERKG